MSFPPGGLPPSSNPSAPSPPPTANLTRLGGADLLLVLILALGGTKLLLPLVGGVATAPVLPGQAAPSEILPVALSILAQSGLTLAVLYLVVIRLRRLSWRDLGLVTPPPGWLVRGLLLAVVTVPLVGIVNLLVRALTGEAIDNPQIEVLSPIAVSITNYLVMVVLAGLLVPLVEELAFRGLVQGWLRERWGPWPAILLSALVFALMHGIPVLLPALMMVGIFLGWLYERSGSLWPAVAMHAAFNIIMTTVLYLALAEGLLPSGSEVSP